MRNYTCEKYKNLVENTKDLHVQNYMREELDFLRKIKNASSRDFIELGAGYGRVGAKLHHEIYSYTGIELKLDMYHCLEKLSMKLHNIVAINDDMTNLPALFQKRQLKDPVLMILQNTLGVLDGKLEEILSAINLFFLSRRGDLVISVLKADTLVSTGLDFYATLAPMIGHYDVDKSDLGKGTFATDTGYVSEWWTKEKMNEIVRRMNASSYEIFEGSNFYIFKLTFDLPKP